MRTFYDNIIITQTNICNIGINVRSGTFVETAKNSTDIGIIQGGHGTGKTGNWVLTFSRQGKHREFCSDTGKYLLTQGKYLDCDY